MISHRQLFFQHLAQTSENPLKLEISRAEGIFLYDTEGNAWTDLLSGISVSNLGHHHPAVIQAVKEQVDKYMHLMVYGEYVQSPQVRFAKLLTDHLPENLNCSYLVNSGSEATEGALKLAKRFTKRTEIISFYNGYHGSTHGALSVLGDENFKRSFRPLLPDVNFIRFNKQADLIHITEKTSCVIVEPIQAEAGMMVPEQNYLKALRKRCTDTGALLIFDEVQTGFGRTGRLFAFQHFDVVPDILTIAKGAGGGMPLGAFISSREIMSVFKHNPVLGHITTFGGHPVSCAAAEAALSVILEEKIPESVILKEKLFRELLNHDAIKEIRGKGLLLAVELKNKELNHLVIAELLKNRIVTGDFLYNSYCFSISPPLIISNQQIEDICKKIIDVLNDVAS